MLRNIEKFFQQNKDREAFLKIVARHYTKDSEGYLLIEKAYEAVNVTQDEQHDGDACHFECLQRVALILMEHLSYCNSGIIALVLLGNRTENTQSDINSWNHADNFIKGAIIMNLADTLYGLTRIWEKSTENLRQQILEYVNAKLALAEMQFLALAEIKALSKKT